MVGAAASPADIGHGENCDDGRPQGFVDGHGQRVVLPVLISLEALITDSALSNSAHRFHVGAVFRGVPFFSIRSG